MVGSRIASQGRSRAASIGLFAIVFGLVLLSGISGCSEEQEQATTIVELQFFKVEDAIPLIAPTIPEGVQYNYSSNNIVFYAAASELTNTINLLKKLDQAPKQYLIEFRIPQKQSTKTYSTAKGTHLPISSLQVMENTQARISTDETIFYPFFESEVTLNRNSSTIRVVKHDDLNSKLELFLAGTRKGQLQSFSSTWVLPHNRWVALSPKMKTTAKTYSTRKKNPLDIEVKITPTSNGF